MTNKKIEIFKTILYGNYLNKMPYDKLDQVFNTPDLFQLRNELENQAKLYKEADQKLWEYCQEHPDYGIMNTTVLAYKTRGTHPDLVPEAVQVGIQLSTMNDMIEKLVSLGIPVIACLEVTRTILSPESPVYPMFA